MNNETKTKGVLSRLLCVGARSLVLLAILGLSTRLFATAITWKGVYDITSDGSADVRTDGSPVDSPAGFFCQYQSSGSYKITSDQTINGTKFQHGFQSNNWNKHIASNGTRNGNTTAVISESNVQTLGTYGKMLSGGVTGTAGNAMSIRPLKATKYKKYLVQIWIQNVSLTGDDAIFYIGTDSSLDESSAGLTVSCNKDDGGLGQYAVFSFLMDSDTAPTFYIVPKTSAGVPKVNMYQLRELPVEEESTSYTWDPAGNSKSWNQSGENWNGSSSSETLWDGDSSSAIFQAGADVAIDSENVLANDVTGNGDLTVTATKDLVVMDDLNVTGVFNKYGNGNLVVRGDMTTSGENTRLQGGTVTVDGTLSLGGGRLTVNPLTFDKDVIAGNPEATTTLVAPNASIPNLPANGKLTLGTAQTVSVSAESTKTFLGILDGAMSLTKAGAGTFEVQGPNTFSGNLTVNEGVFKCGVWDYESSIKYAFDTSDTSAWEKDDSTGEVTKMKYSSSVGEQLTFEGDADCKATISEDDNYFDGKSVLRPKEGGYYNTGSIASMALAVYQINEAEISDSTKFYTLFSSTHANDAINFRKDKGSYFPAYSWTDWATSSQAPAGEQWAFYVDGSNIRTVTPGRKSIMRVTNRLSINNNNTDRLGTATTTHVLYVKSNPVQYPVATFPGAIAEVIGFNKMLTFEQCNSVEMWLMQKWNLTDKLEYQPIPYTAAVSVANGATLDLGPFSGETALTVKSASFAEGSIVAMDAMPADGVVLKQTAGNVYESANVTVKIGGETTTGYKIVSSESDVKLVAVPTTPTVTIPALSNMTLVSVTVGGETVQETSAGVYTVEAGSTVVVTFAPAAGYFLSATTVTLENVTANIEVTPPTSTYIMATVNDTPYGSFGDAAGAASAGDTISIVGAYTSGSLSFSGAFAGKTVEFGKMLAPTEYVWVGTGASEYLAEGTDVTWKSVDGTASYGINQSAGNFVVADGANQNARLTVESGSYSFAGAMYAANANATQYLTIEGGSIYVAGQVWLGYANGSVSKTYVKGGTFGNGNWFCVGRGAGCDTYLEVDGGTVSSTGNITIGTCGDSTSKSEMVVKSGTVTTSQNLYVGEWDNAIVTIEGGNVTANYNVVLGDNAAFASGETATLNLDGGTLTTWKIAKGSGTGTTVVNFNGGTLKALGEQNVLIDSTLSSVNITGANGMIIDSDYAVSIPASVTKGDGDFTPTLTKKGTGTLWVQSLPSGTEVSVEGGSVTVPQSSGAVAAAGTLRTADGDNYVFTVGSTMDPGATSATTYDDQTTAEAAATAVTVAVPTAVAERLTDDQEAAYVAMFEAKAVESTTESGKYVVTVDFTAAAEAEIKAAENAITVVDGATPQVTVTAKPGLYYFVKAGTAADSLTETGNGTMATSESVTLDMPLPDSGVKYYKVVASPTSSL